jgi:transcriptional antiterminator RfaH
MDHRWAVLRSQPRREVVAARALTARGVESYMPWLSGAPNSNSNKPLFPGYLFARLSRDSDDLLRVRSAQGVAYVLPRGGEPTLLPDAFIENLREQERVHALNDGAPEFHHGDRVVVVSGPFKWAEGLFDRGLTARGRVRILLDLVHGSAAVQLGASDVRKARPRHGRAAA